MMEGEREGAVGGSGSGEAAREGKEEERRGEVGQGGGQGKEERGRKRREI